MICINLELVIFKNKKIKKLKNFWEKGGEKGG